MTTLAVSVRFPATQLTSAHPLSSSSSSARPRQASAGITHHPLRRATPLRISRKRPLFAFRAVEESKESPESSEAATEPDPEAELTRVGSEISKAMEERKASSAAAAAAEEEGLLGGVWAEVKEIEWPAFGKVLGTTWVVLGVIAGSSVVLLTLNVVLAELSDKVFAGRGVQDFFG